MLRLWHLRRAGARLARGRAGGARSPHAHERASCPSRSPEIAFVAHSASTTAPSSNGRTCGFGPQNGGSNPPGAMTMDGISGLSVPSHGFKLLSGAANRRLAEEMARHIGVELCKVTLSRFADGEIFVRIDENIRGNDVFIIQPTNPPAENVLELLLLIDAAKRASAARITVVMPYYGYARQDRKDQPRVAIGAKLLANMIQGAGANR